MILELMKESLYPDTQYYEPETLKPLNESTKFRLKFLEQIPEMKNGGILVDIGCGKGLIPMVYSKYYKKIIGVEPENKFYKLCIDINLVHGNKHIEFINTDFRGINSFDKFNPVFGDVVFVGNVHHYFFMNEIKYNTKPFMFLKKLAGMCGKYLIIDGPFEMNDPAVIKISVDDNWDQKTKELYAWHNFENMLKPQFKLKYKKLNQANVREIAVFERVLPDIKSVQYKDCKEMFERGEKIPCNKNRMKNDIVKIDNKRYKIEYRGHPDSTYLIHNSLPEHFPKTSYVIKIGNKNIGDVTEWVNDDECKKFKKFEELTDYYIQFQNELNVLGLFEPQFAYDDYRIINNKAVLLDADMMDHYTHFVGSKTMEKWVKNCYKVTNDWRIQYIKDRFHKINCYSELLKGEQNELYASTDD